MSDQTPPDTQKTEDQAPPTDTTQPIERDPSAPVQQADNTPGFVHLPGLLADEFGIARSVARRDLLMGKVMLDGEQVHLDERLDLPREGNVGKTVEVHGGDTNRIFRVQIQ